MAWETDESTISVAAGNGRDVAAGMFNTSIAAFAVASASEIGLLDEIVSAGEVDVCQYAKDKELHRPSVRALTDALASAGVLHAEGDVVRGTDAFPEVFETKGFFTWLLGGCGELLRTAGTVARQSERRGQFIQRDARAIGIGTADFGAQFIDPVFDDSLKDHKFTCVADLGCGSGARLIRILRANPDATGVGVDGAPGAVELAREQLAEAGLSDRAVIVQGDVHNLPRLPEFDEVDFVTSFLMGHDFWPREDCINVFHNLQRAFPNLRSFALCDTYRSAAVPSRNLPILTLGFEHVHALMGQYLPTLQEWREVFAETGWSVHREHDLTLPPHSKIFHLVPPGSSGI